MHLTSTPSFSALRSRLARCPYLRGALGVVAAGLLVAHPAHGQSIPVPNGSFENPTTGFVTTIINNWTKTSQPGFFDPAAAGFTWDQTTGLFVNTTSPSNEITNLDGNQAAFVIGIPTAGFYQELGTAYTVGQQYLMSFGTISEAPAGDTINLIAYYRDSGNNIVPIAINTVTSLGSGVPNITQLQYSSLAIPTVTAADPWAGKPIGIEVIVGQGTGGDWDVDNVTVVPEPAATGLFGFGALGLLARRRRRIA